MAVSSWIAVSFMSAPAARRYAPQTLGTSGKSCIADEDGVELPDPRLQLRRIAGGHPAGADAAVRQHHVDAQHGQPPLGLPYALGEDDPSQDSSVVLPFLPREMPSASARTAFLPSIARNSGSSDGAVSCGAGASAPGGVGAGALTAGAYAGRAGTAGAAGEGVRTPEE